MPQPLSGLSKVAAARQLCILLIQRRLKAFDENHYTTVNVYVPQEALAAYQSADGWKEFWNLHSIDDVSTAIMQPRAATDIETVNGYTLEGKGQTMKKTDVQSLPSGIYIVDSKKYVVK